VGPEGTKSQDQPSDSGEPILARIERDHRRIALPDPELKSLRGEHRRVLKAVKALRQQLREIDQLEGAEEQKERLGRIREDMSAFMELVRCHERTETRLVADTYYLEEGGSG
jgi:hypothetical protein